MNITILTFGTRGDVEPHLALAIGLQRRGHRVKLVAPAGYADWIRSHGVAVHVQSVSVDDKHSKPESLPRVPADRPRKSRRERAAAELAWHKTFLDDYWAASADADLILQAGFAYGGIDVALQRGVPIAFLFPHPITPTREAMCYRSPLRVSLGGSHNYLSHWISMRHAWGTFGPPINSWRAERFNLPPWPSYRHMVEAVAGAPTLCAYSESVVPRYGDWPDTDIVTGYWFLDLDPAWQPPADLVRFLEAGPPPIHVGFGSMRLHFPERATRIVLEAIRRSGQRAVVSLGKGDALKRLPAPDTVHYIDSIPHRWLFPRMAAVVHHGGAGTTAAVLNAGVPGVVVPIAYDQFGWSQRIRQLGVGAGSGHVATTTAGRLTRMIRRVIEDRDLRRRAAALGETIRSERGVDVAVDIIERYARQPRSKAVA
jgi:sterol 3beta-glucosyltransferase